MPRNTISVELTFEDDSFEYRDVPAKWVICETCDGDGKRGNPAFDGMAYPGDEDPDFWFEYFNGTYDVRCDECDGTGKVQEPQLEPGEEEDAYWRTLQNKADHAALIASERRLGA